MLGFKLQASRPENSMSTKTRPIYLDMQVSLPSQVSNFRVINLVHYRLQPPLTLEFLMPCYLTLRISMAILIVGPMLMDGKLSRLWKMLERYHSMNYLLPLLLSKFHSTWQILSVQTLKTSYLLRVLRKQITWLSKVLLVFIKRKNVT